MSKAFTKEDDSVEELVLEDLALPPGVRNYLTPEGAAELGRQLEAVRQALAVAVVAKKPALERRLGSLTRRFETAEVVDPAKQPHGIVRFGATVVVENSDGKTRQFRIVGIDEAQPADGRISWRSPMAKALLGTRVGDEITVQTPHGPDALSLVAIRYE